MYYKRTTVLFQETPHTTETVPSVNMWES